MVILYSEDYAVSGPRKEAQAILDKLDRAFRFGSRRPLREYVGIQRLDLATMAEGLRRYVLYQEGYLRLCVPRYMQDP